MATTSLVGPVERAFLEAARTATLATIAPNGRPRLVPICFVVAGGAPDAPDGSLRLLSPLDDKPKRSDERHDLARVRDLLARPEATLLVDRWSEDWTRLGWIRLETRADLLEPGPPEGAEHAAAVTALRAKYQQYATHRLEARPMLRFVVERAVAWAPSRTADCQRSR